MAKGGNCCSLAAVISEELCLLERVTPSPVPTTMATTNTTTITTTNTTTTRTGKVTSCKIPVIILGIPTKQNPKVYGSEGDPFDRLQHDDNAQLFFRKTDSETFRGGPQNDSEDRLYADLLYRLLCLPMLT